MASAITEAVISTGSLRDKLRAARVVQTGDTIHELEIPGYQGQLVARYKTLDWRSRRRIGLLPAAGEIPAKELFHAAMILVDSCVGVDAHVDGQRVPVTDENGPLRLGAALASFLGEEGAETDVQGVMLIFPSELALMNHVGQLAELQSAEDERADGEVAGN